MFLCIQGALAHSYLPMELPCFGFALFFSMPASSCCCHPTARCITSTGAQEQLPFYWSDVDGATA